MTCHVITLGFSPARIIRRGMERFYATLDSKRPIKHYLVDQHYPLHRESNLDGIVKIVKEYNLTLLDSGHDRGLHHGLNWTIAQIQPNEGDIIVMFDPDGGPTRSGWLEAAIFAIEQGKYSIAGLCDPQAVLELNERGHTETHLDKLRIWEPHQACIASITAWDYSFLKAMGPFHEHNNYYGGLEAYVWSHLKRLGKKWAYLPDFNEENYSREMTDWEYTKYKWCHAQWQSFSGSFADFLAQNCPGKDPPDWVKKPPSEFK